MKTFKVAPTLALLSVISISAPVRSFAQEASTTTSPRRARMFDARKADPGDSVSVTVVLVPKIGVEGAVGQIVRFAEKKDQVFLMLTEGARPKDLARALSVIKDSPISTAPLDAGELRAPIRPVESGEGASEAKLSEAAKLLGRVRSSAARTQVEGHGTGPSIALRLQLDIVATKRE